MDRFDVIVIGGGHAGAEAAWAAAHLGAKTAMITLEREAIGRMSCNPAIGGLGKGHMVREIDALGGLMGRVTDDTGIQFRMLNRSKGPAVWAPRAQVDRDRYAAGVQRYLADAPNLTIIEGIVEDLLTKPVTDRGCTTHGITGVRLDDGRNIEASTVIITTGTFMRALMHCGKAQSSGGRVGERASFGLSAALESLGFELGRLKTGTPPRVLRDSIDYRGLQPQPGDEHPTPFSFVNTSIDQRQIDCWITYTNDRTHSVIRAHLHEAPMFSGQIKSRGPRYCPSIEDKVVRFADKPRHQLFLEPEGVDSERVYCNGISTSLPAQVQREMIGTIPGLQNAKIIQPGYAVEYDWVPTHQIQLTLETKRVANLFLAGQINGTSGYEEAAAQGLVAGINAVHALDGRDPLILGRDQCYIGVLIDDLVTRPPDEPYRMFTSRAEYRLYLRCDNADQRLTPIGRQVGLVDDSRWSIFEHKMTQVDQIKRHLQAARTNGVSLSDQLKRPEVTADDLHTWLCATGQGSFDRLAIQQVHIDAKYAGYIARQQRQIDRFQRLEAIRIPQETDFDRISEMRLEAREKLARIKPRTLGQASRISGINPADITVLWVCLSRAKHRLSHSTTASSAAQHKPSPCE
ncbi:MAG: tRNA uridine-5-carboxymethylaminomethyl(34) synthesis enzyme MnmG [Phycisphaerae bacterium]